MPAGHGMGQLRDDSSRSLPKHSMMDDDEEMIAAARRMIPPSQHRPSDTLKAAWKGLRDRYNGVPKVLTGERMIHINNPPLNESSKFANNYVSTSKYSLLTFIPKFFAGELLDIFISFMQLRQLTRVSKIEQFSKYANVFFLFTALIQQIPNVSPTNQYTTILPLSLVLLVAAFKEAQEDLVNLLLTPFPCQRD